MKTWMLPTVVALSASLLTAQAQDASAKKKEAAAKEQYLALAGKYNKEQSDFMAAIAKVQQSEAFKEAQAARDRQAMTALFKDLKRPDVKDHLPGFVDAAKKYTDTQAATDFLTWIVMNGSSDKDAVTYAVETIAERHLGSDCAYMLAVSVGRWSRALGQEGVGEVLDKIIKTSKDPEARAEAIYNRAMMVRRNRGASDDEKEAAKEALEKLKKDMPDSTPILRMNGKAFARERLDIDMQAPDIEGVDLDGVKFKLSDYLGKVVVLDFWGDW